MKSIIKLIIFLIIFVILLHNVFTVLWLNPKTSISYFYDEPKNSLDVICIGTSNIYAHFNSVLAYDLYGFTTGIMANDVQHPASIKYLINEAQKYQKPNLYIIDLTKMVGDMDSFTDGNIRKTIDSMKFSKNRLDAINEILGYKNVEKNISLIIILVFLCIIMHGKI